MGRHRRELEEQRTQPSEWRDRWPVIRFVLLFAGAMLLFQILFLTLVVDSGPFASYLELSTRISGGLLSAVGQEVIVTHNELYIGGSSVLVSTPCSGMQPMAMFSIAILAFPSSFKAKGLGLLAGIGVLQVMNVVRIATLAFVSTSWPASFEPLHMFVWPMAFVLISIAMWVLWARRALEPAV